jgi:hypothetical protein
MLDHAESYSQPDLKNYMENLNSDVDTLREPNTAANFWHNFRIDCRQQANNESEAVKAARIRISEMDENERGKMKNGFLEYNNEMKKNEKLHGIKSDSDKYTGYNKRIYDFYNENVKDLRFAKNGLRSSADSKEHLTMDIKETTGTAISENMKLKIGDTIKLSMETVDLLKLKATTTAPQDFTIVSSSKSLDKIVVVTKDNTSKYTISLKNLEEEVTRSPNITKDKSKDKYYTVKDPVTTRDYLSR